MARVSPCLATTANTAKTARPSLTCRVRKLVAAGKHGLHQNQSLAVPLRKVSTATVQPHSGRHVLDRRGHAERR